MKDGVVTKYISAADMKVAQVRGTEVSYYHKDHLNSSTVMTNNSGTKVEETAYAPYGTMRAFTGTAVTNYRYTGKEIDPETNLYYYGARYYDPMIGRFITADSIVSDIYDPQDLNRYAYCRNNPMKYVDPDGHAWFDAIPGTIGAVGNFGATGLAYVFTRPAIGALWLIDPKGAAQANSGLNDAFGRVLHIQTGIAASAVVGDTAGAAVGAGVQYVKNARQAARATAEVAKEVQAASKNTIQTPHGSAVQALSAEAQTALSEVRKGSQVYRQGQFGVQNTADAQFWAIQNPANTSNYAKQLGMPTSGVDWMMGGTVKPGANVITRPAPGIGNNVGGKMEAVVQPGGVQIDWFHMP